MLGITGFFGFWFPDCFRGIFSNRTIPSHVFPCNIGKYIGKVSGFTNGLFQPFVTRSTSAFASSKFTWV